ncbi:hypothetical protein GCM10009665_29420 [Kitasatospora nipponensis]|uniref:Uncharacterized protein n=1 Tax=Kitasatospora nipponensis TaxID=258049 RepID=A0ABN1W6D1_9ACTN
MQGAILAVVAPERVQSADGSFYGTPLVTGMLQLALSHAAPHHPATHRCRESLSGLNNSPGTASEEQIPAGPPAPSGRTSNPPADNWRSGTRLGAAPPRPILALSAPDLT